VRGSARVSGLLAMLAVVVTATAHAEWLHRDEDGIMGTRITVELWSEDAVAGEAAIDAVMDEMRHIDATMSVYIPTSEVSKVNAEAGAGPVKISKELFDLLRTSVDYSVLTEGAFDITYASVGYLYDFRAHHRPTEEQIKSALPSVDYRNLKFDPAALTVQFIGDRFGKPWMVGIRHPDHADQVIIRLPLSDTAISTSGDYERFYDEGGVRYHHIIDPRTGHSASRVRSATVLAPTATRTDGLSKTAFVLGPEEALKIYSRLPDVDAVLVTPQGKVLYTKGLQPPETAH